MSRLSFEIQATCAGTQARAARFQTLHGEILSPLFMPVGTQATVKAQLPECLEDSGSQILLANTYHLMLRPGAEVFDALGGYHGFTTWPRSVLTDSGGFQIFSLRKSFKISEEGAAFQSYVDGKRFLLSPELSIATQKSIGSDIMMVLDQCIPSTAGIQEARAAMELTHRWAKRSLEARGDSPQALFAIVQGALFEELREQSADTLCQMPFDGFAIGGLAVGESKQEREDTCEFTTALMPQNRPRYMMGVGTPLDILEAVHRGVDMFDCIIPTQYAQHGTAFTSKGLIKLRRGVYRFSDEALDSNCHCPTCKRFSRAYLHHLSKASETLAWQLIGQHNIYFYHQMMRDIRKSIYDNSFLELYRERREYLQETDLENPSVDTPQKKRAKRERGQYEIFRHNAGFSCIRHKESGELMHSHSPPMVEAQRLYVEQSNLAQALQREGEALVLWDVGLGAAANAMAAIQCAEKLLARGQLKRPLHIHSFENDLDSLQLAFRHEREFTYLRHAAPAALLKEGRWKRDFSPKKKHVKEVKTNSDNSYSIQWFLHHGDFAEELAKAPAPQLIYFDMFSQNTNFSEWQRQRWQDIHQRVGDRACALFTYSASTAVRASLLSAGFYVARGQATGVKTESTIALTKAAVPPSGDSADTANWDLLGASWLEKWHRSAAKFPASITEGEREAFASQICTHPQFS